MRANLTSLGDDMGEDEVRKRLREYFKERVTGDDVRDYYGYWLGRIRSRVSAK